MKEAEQEAREALTVETNLQFFAMAQHHSKETEAARVSLKKCAEVVQTQLSKLADGDHGRDWRGWIFAHALQSEAKKLIEGEPSSTAHPGDLPR